MLNKKQIMIQEKRNLFTFLFLLICCAGFATENKAADTRSYYEIKLFRVATNEQVAQVEGFLKNDFIPALHRIEELTETDAQLKAANAFLDAAYNASPFLRSESIVLKAFPMMPSYNIPSLTGNKTERVYELRSYESATQKLYRQKVKMFNVGGEVALFKRLNFNAVFYGEVIAGSRMPNLMYMTSFNNRADRDAHWKQFGEDAEWKILKDLPEYANTVSRNETILLNPAEFSEL
jgi:hypothetical protein